jgi:peptide/nickel transport system ATP-binding protein
VADEPTSALDVVVQKRVMQTLRRMQERIGAALILISHDLGLMARFVDRVAVMRAGQLVEVNPVEQIFTAPQHPYTRQLLESLPSFENRASSVQSVAAHSSQRTTPILEADGVTKVFGSGGPFRRHQTVALKAFSLALHPAQPSITAVVGESGSGKSTMARLLLGLESPTTGSVRYAGTDLRQLSRSARTRFRREVQAVFQDPFGAYNPHYPVDHVLEVPIARFGLADTREQARALIHGAVLAVGLRPEETLGRYPHQLSGGQRQRLMVARALLLNPKVIIADEPVSMIDASLRVTVLANMRRLKDEFGISVLYITHDLTTAYQISDTVIVLHRGEVVEQGEIELVKRPQHAYTQLLVSSIPLPDPRSHWEPEPERRSG